MAATEGDSFLLSAMSTLPPSPHPEVLCASKASKDWAVKQLSPDPSRRRYAAPQGEGVIFSIPAPNLSPILLPLAGCTTIERYQCWVFLQEAERSQPSNAYGRLTVSAMFELGFVERLPGSSFAVAKRLRRSVCRRSPVEDIKSPREGRHAQHTRAFISWPSTLCIELNSRQPRCREAEALS